MENLDLTSAILGAATLHGARLLYMAARVFVEYRIAKAKTDGKEDENDVLWAQLRDNVLPLLNPFSRKK